ncbi:cobalamin biosynthesis protein, partial [Salmonella enterica]|uniref:cobalamin biosynthesis protein n=1 Tax=Salmonella enterica TaxID=28901 RepID=UPI00398C7F4D
AAAHAKRAEGDKFGESAVDGLNPPLFVRFRGGGPVAMTYKDVKTLDLRGGYKHEKYRAFGMVSARIDDVANYLPARLSWLLLCIAAGLCRLTGRRALRLCRRARYTPSSPVCPLLEPCLARACRIRLRRPHITLSA